MDPTRAMLNSVRKKSLLCLTRHKVTDVFLAPDCINFIAVITSDPRVIIGVDLEVGVSKMWRMY